VREGASAAIAYLRVSFASSALKRRLFLFSPLTVALVK